MRNSLLLVLGLVAPLAHGTPDIQHWQTANGAEVYFVEAHDLPMVDVRVIFDGGSARDGGHAGVAVLTNGLLAEGADGLSADEISDNFEANGAIFEAGALRDMAWVSLRSLTDPEKLEPAVANLSRVLSRPDFPADVLDRERSRLLVALRYKQQSPSDLAQDAFYRAVYGGTPLCPPLRGHDDISVSMRNGIKGTGIDCRVFHYFDYRSSDSPRSSKSRNCTLPAAPFFLSTQLFGTGDTPWV